MGTDNVDIYKRIIFRIPELRYTAALITVLGFLYSGAFYIALELFAGNLIPGSVITPLLVPVLAVTLFILPTFISGFMLHRFLPDYPARWGYFLAMVNQFIIFVYSLILSGANNMANAWSIFWLGLITVYMSNFFVLLVSVGYSRLKRIGLLGLVQPLAILGAFHLGLGTYTRIGIESYLMNLGIVVFAGLLLLGIILMAEYLIVTNIPNVTAMGLTSSLLQKRQETLELGYPTRPEVQTLRIENETDSVTLAVPWLHPGPLEAFGGGKITTDIIESLNEDGKGFFLHVPSTHKSDPTDPGDYRKVLDAISEPEMNSNASKLLKRKYGELTFYGRKIDGKNIIFMEPSEGEKFDDYEMSVFREIIDLDETVLVDLHNHNRDQKKRKEVWYNTETAEMMREYLLDFIDELEEQEKGEYQTGFAVEPEDTPRFAMVEKVGDQETLLFGIEGNEAAKELQELRDEYSREFDEVMLFTTDTHRSIHELSREKQVEKDAVRKVVDCAREGLSPGLIGFSMERAEKMDLLQEDYSGIIYSINIIVRLIPLTLLLLYIALVIWVF